jgi:hypothetical protein
MMTLYYCKPFLFRFFMITLTVIIINLNLLNDNIMDSYNGFKEKLGAINHFTKIKGKLTFFLFFLFF